MAHDGWCTGFSAGLHPLGDQSGAPFSPEIPKIAKKCPQKGSKRGAQNGSPRGRNQKKVEKYFFSGPTMWGYIGPPPSKKHGSVEVSGTQTMLSPNFEKKCGNTPRRMVQRGGFPHFFSKIGDNMVWGGETFLKNWPKGGVPLFWALFGNFGDFR